MTDTYKTELEKVRSARIRLLKDHPFFGDLAFGLPIKFDDKLDPKTAATDGNNIYYHPEFVNRSTPAELVFVKAHEIGHCMLMHIVRRGNRNPGRWNVACDVVVNELLINNRIGTPPKGIIYIPEIYAQANGLVEKVYDLLPEDFDQEPLDAMIEPKDGEKGEFEAKWRGNVAKAAATAKAAGQLTGDLEAFVDQLTTPKVSWRERFREFITKTRGTDRTYTKINRRMQAVDTILPGVIGEQLGEIVFAIDCSGSTDDEMISQCSGELASIQEELRPSKIHVLFFDEEIKKHDEYEADDPIEVKAYGRGGTRFASIFEYIEQNNIEPENCIVATDLECNDFGPQPNYPVLWCVMQGNETDAPWGEVLVVD